MQDRHMLVLSEFNIAMIQICMQTNNNAFTISSVQDACLEHADVLSAFHQLRKQPLLSDSYLQNDANTTKILNREVPYKWKFHFSRTSLVIRKITKVMLLDFEQ